MKPIRRSTDSNDRNWFHFVLFMIFCPVWIVAGLIGWATGFAVIMFKLAYDFAANTGWND